MKTLRLILLVFFLTQSFVGKAQESAVQGYVLDVDRSIVFIDLGSDRVKTDDVLLVFSPRSFFEHPVTGEIIEKEEEAIAKIIVTITRDRYSECLMVGDGETAVVQKGMVVRSEKFARMVEDVENVLGKEINKQIKTADSLADVVNRDVEVADSLAEAVNRDAEVADSLADAVNRDAVEVDEALDIAPDQEVEQEPDQQEEEPEEMARVISYQEREFQVTGVVNRGSKHGVRPADQFSVHLLKKVSDADARKFRKRDYFFAGFTQVLNVDEDQADMYIALRDKSNISKLIMPNYLLPYYPVRRHNIVGTIGFALPLGHANYKTPLVFNLTGGYRVYLASAIFTGVNVGISRFQSFRLYSEIPVGIMINPDTYRNTRFSLMANFRLMNYPHNPADSYLLPRIIKRNFRGILQRDWVFPSFAIETQYKNWHIQFPEICLDNLSSGKTERRPVIGFRVSYMLGFGGYVHSPFE